MAQDIGRLSPTSALNQNLVTATGSTTARSLAARFADVVNVKDYGAKGDGVTDDTAALASAFTAGAATGAEVYLPAGTYRVVPATVVLGEGQNFTVAFRMASHLHLRAERGATIKLADNQSTDAAPKLLGIFFSNQFLSDLSFRGIIFDLNGANNKISPSRPTTYNRYNQAAIMFSGTPGGVAAGANDVLIEDCEFRNTAGVSQIVMAQSNTAGVTLGRNWTIRKNKFLNNGLDTDDHSSIFGWADDVTIVDNVFDADTMQGTVGKTGGIAAYEVHGARQLVKGNRIRNYLMGMWISDNLTSAAEDVLVTSNIIGPVKDYGVGFFREGATDQAIQRIQVTNNTIRITDDASLNTQKAAILFGTWSFAGGVAQGPSYAIDNVLIAGNRAEKIGSTVGAAFAIVLASQQATAQKHNHITVRDNQAIAFAQGVYLATTTTNGFGVVEIVGNSFFDLKAAGAFSTSFGIQRSGSTTIDYLNLDGNRFIDTQAVPTFQYGILLGGTTTTLRVGPQSYSGMTVANYAESTPTVTARQGTGIVNVLQPAADTGLPQTGAVYQGAGVPSNANGNNGDVYFRTDTPATASQRAYVKSAGAWVAQLGLSNTPTGVSAITVTASPFTYTNNDGVQEAVYVSGGTVSAIAKNAVTLFAASPATVWLAPGEAVMVTYTAAPTMNKDLK